MCVANYESATQYTPSGSESTDLLCRPSHDFSQGGKQLADGASGQGHGGFEMGSFRISGFEFRASPKRPRGQRRGRA